MFPQISIVGYLFGMMTWLGWINTYAALMFPYITVGTAVGVVDYAKLFFTLSTELDKAA